MPYGGIGVRPRAITFIQRGIQAVQIFPSIDQTVDYRFLKVSGLTFVNVYRAPGSSGSLEPLITWKPHGPSIAGGDFNAVSQQWQPKQIDSMEMGIKL